MYRSLVFFAIGLVCLSASLVSASDAVLEQFYGSGVHAFFSRDYVKAHEYLTTAIDGGSVDPRPYYFRGMAYLKLGRAEEAELDFKKGATKESRDVNKFYNVSKSLERIQGRARLTLEQHRVVARMAARQEAEKLHKARYEQIRQEEGRLLQQQIDESPAIPATTSAAEPAGDEAFGAGPLTEPAAEEPVAKEPADADPFAEEPADADPFAEEPAAEEPAAEEPIAEEPAEADPFTDEPSAEEPAAQPATGKKSGIFGALGRSLGKAVGGGQDQGDTTLDEMPLEDEPAEPAADEPFGGADDEPAEPAGDDPFGADEEEEQAEPAADDPFGADEEEPAEPAADEPAGDDPFGADEPAADEPAEPADDDPFGADEPAADEPAEEEPAEEEEVDLDDPFAE